MVSSKPKISDTLWWNLNEGSSTVKKLRRLFGVYYLTIAVYFIIANIRLNVRSGLDPIPEGDRLALLGIALIVPFVPIWPNWREINKVA